VRFCPSDESRLLQPREQTRKPHLAAGRPSFRLNAPGLSFLSAVYAERVALLPARSDLVGGLPFASLLSLFI